MRKPTDTEDQKRLASGGQVQLLREVAEPEQLFFLLIADVRERTRYSQSGIYALMAREKNPFPKPYRLSANRVAWLKSEVDGWLLARIQEGPAMPQGNLTKQATRKRKARAA